MGAGVINRLRRQLLAALHSQLSGSKARPPAGGALIWQAFYKLSRARSWHAHGPNPISFPEIEAYCRLHRLPLEPRHIEIIALMDEAWIGQANETLAKAGGKGRGPSALPGGVRQPISAALFDAAFG